MYIYYNEKRNQVKMLSEKKLKDCGNLKFIKKELTNTEKDAFKKPNHFHITVKNKRVEVEKKTNFKTLPLREKLEQIDGAKNLSEIKELFKKNL